MRSPLGVGLPESEPDADDERLARPMPRPAPDTTAAWWPIAAVAGLVIAVTVVGATVFTVLRPEPVASAPTPFPDQHRSPRSDGACPPPAPVVSAAAAESLEEADVDGNGCPDAVLRSGHVLLRASPAGGTERFVVGEPGDLAVVGDWDCDGLATPGVYRRDAGRAFMFDRWAVRGAPLPSSSVVAASAPPTRPDC